MSDRGTTSDLPVRSGDVADVDFAALTASDEPWVHWRRVRDDRPVFFSAGYQSWFVTRDADVRAALRDTDTFSSRNAFTPNRPLPQRAREILDAGGRFEDLVVNLDPPEHAKIRRIVSGALSRPHVTELGPTLQAVADTLVDGFHGAGCTDLVSSFSLPYPSIVVLNGLLGVPLEDAPRHVRWAECMSRLLGGEGSDDELEDAARGFVDHQRYWQIKLEQRRREPREDLLTAFLEHNRSEGLDLTIEQLAFLPTGLSSAGVATTAQAISLGVLLLLADPDARAQVLADDEAMSHAVDEILRFEAPVQMLRRFTTREIEVSGTSIPASANVMLVVGSAHHDPDACARPDVFDPSRDRPAEHLAFGYGSHFCLGAPLARRELSVCLRTILGRLPGLRLAGKTPITRTAHPWHRGISRLDLEWDV